MPWILDTTRLWKHKVGKEVRVNKNLFHFYVTSELFFNAEVYYQHFPYFSLDKKMLSKEIIFSKMLIIFMLLFYSDFKIYVAYKH